MAPPLRWPRIRGIRGEIWRSPAHPGDGAGGRGRALALTILLAIATLALAFAALALVACDPGEDERVAAGPPPAEYLAAHLGALCAGLVACGEYEDAVACSELLGPSHAVDPDLEAAIAEGSVIVDGEAARACLDFLDQAPCVAGSFTAGSLDAGCPEVFRGTRGGGEPCQLSAQCRAGACLLPRCSDACCQGFCVEPPGPAALGDACEVAKCVHTAYCRPDIEVCAPRRGDGSPCVEDDACEPHLVCEGGRCQPPPLVGEACVHRCGRLGLRCDPRGRCVAAAFEGAACDPFIDTCGGLLRCDPGTTTCRPPPAIGERCHGACAAGAFCDEVDPVTFHGACAPLRGDGEPCSADHECASRSCNGAAGCGASRCVDARG